MTTAWPADFLQRLVDGAPEGIVICEAYGDEQPVVYVNRQFEALTGYAASELLGRDLRRLQGGDRDQQGRSQLRAAVQQGRADRAVLRNYRKDGTPFWNEVLIEPLRATDGTLTHFVGFHRLVEAPISLELDAPTDGAAVINELVAASLAVGRAEAAAAPVVGLPRWMREDRLTGLNSRSYFEEQLRHQWAAGQREGRALTLLRFEIESLAAYRETFGRTAVDACVRKVARLLAASFRRGTDILARWEEGTFCVLAQSADLAATAAYTRLIVQRLFEMQIHHPRATRSRFVTMTCGVAQLIPAIDMLPETLLQAAADAAQLARNEDVGKLVPGQE